jgi:hypothetical protein
MTSVIDNDNERFDRAARQLHGVAVTQLGPDTLARLRRARHASARPSHRTAWWLATACSGLLAVGIGLQFRPASLPTASTASHPVASQAADGNDYAPLATLDENPDLYMWLGSDNALAME